MMRRGWSSLGFGFLLCGCLGQRELAAPSAGGDPWAELTSEHFRVVTDLPERDAANVISEYEHIYQLLAAATRLAASQRTTETPSFFTQAVVFRSYDELQPFVPPQIGGMYKPRLANDIQGVPTLLVSGTASPFGRALFTHELAHRFNHVVLGAVPIWLDEGLAQFYSTIRGESSNPVIGESDPENVAAAGSVYQSVGDMVYQGSLIHIASLPSASSLIELTPDEFHARAWGVDNGPQSYDSKNTESRNYAASWLLVHLLFNSTAEYAVRFRDTLTSPNQESTGFELQRVLRSVDAAQLDRDFRAYGMKQIPWRQHHAPRSTRVQFQSRELTDAQTLTWWARLDAFDGDFAARASKRLSAAQKASPADPNTAFWLARYDQLQHRPAAAEAMYEQALELDNRHSDALLGLLTLYDSSDGQKQWAEAERSRRYEAVVARLRVAAKSPLELNTLAVYAIEHQNPVEASTLAERAAQRGSDCWQCWHSYALATYLNGDPGRALELERAAFARALGQGSDQAFSAIQTGLALYQKANRAGTTPDATAKLPLLFVAE